MKDALKRWFCPSLVFLPLIFATSCTHVETPRQNDPSAANAKAAVLQPDAPVPFGYKTNWFAIRTTDTARVIRTLELQDVKDSTWNDGITASYVYDMKRKVSMIFVTPPVRGWTLVNGNLLPYPERCDNEPACDRRDRFDALFGKLVHEFDEVQYFGTYRVVGFDAWGRARHGAIERLFAYADGRVLENIGRQTAEEHALGLFDFGGRDAKQAEKYGMERGWGGTDEENTLAVAGKWSVNPGLLDKMGLPAGLGYVGRLPGKYVQ